MIASIATTDGLAGTLQTKRPATRVAGGQLPAIVAFGDEMLLNRRRRQRRFQTLEEMLRGIESLVGTPHLGKLFWLHSGSRRYRLSIAADLVVRGD